MILSPRCSNSFPRNLTCLKPESGLFWLFYSFHVLLCQVIFFLLISTSRPFSSKCFSLISDSTQAKLRQRWESGASSVFPWSDEGCIQPAAPWRWRWSWCWPRWPWICWCGSISCAWAGRHRVSRCHRQSPSREAAAGSKHTWAGSQVKLPGFSAHFTFCHFNLLSKYDLLYMKLFPFLHAT